MLKKEVFGRCFKLNSDSTVVPKHVCTHLEPRLTEQTKQCRQNVSVHCMFLPRLSQV